MAGGEGRQQKPAGNSALLRGKKDSVHLVGGAASSTINRGFRGSGRVGMADEECVCVWEGGGVLQDRH